MPTIAVADEVLADEETPVRVTGLEPGQRVELVASTDDWFDQGCESRTVYEADADGAVDTSNRAPVDGDSDDPVAPMRWLWSMRPDGAGGFVGGREPVEIDLAVRVDDEIQSTATTVRRPTDSEVTHHAVEDDVVGDLFVPAGDGPHPGAIVLHGSEGQPARGAAALLAGHGIAAFAVHYFGDPEPIPNALSEIPLEYFDDAARILRDREAVADDAIGLYGQSKGAEAALAVAARYEWPDVVVAVAPAAHRWQGLDRSSEEETGSWTADGEVLPYLPFRAAPGSDEDGNVVLREVYENSLPRIADDRIDAAWIPVADSDADVLLVAGGDDDMWPSADYAAQIESQLAERSSGECECLVYDDAGHGIAPPYRPMVGTTAIEGTALGGTPAGNARAGADFWPRALDRLKTERG